MRSLSNATAWALSLAFSAAAAAEEEEEEGGGGGGGGGGNVLMYVGEGGWGRMSNDNGFVQNALYPIFIPRPPPYEKKEKKKKKKTI